MIARKQATTILLGASVAVLLALTACEEDPELYSPAYSSHYLGTPAGSLPPAVATAQMVDVYAQATVASGRGQMVELSVRATEVSLSMEMAMATQEVFTRQTQDAYAQTLTADVTNRTATSQAYEQTRAAGEALQQTAVAQTTGTAVAFANLTTATAQSVQTATAWPLTATPIAATQAAIARAVERDQYQAYWDKLMTPFWVFLWALVVVLFGGALLLAYRRLMPVLELRLRTIISEDGEIVTYLPANQQLTALQPKRNFGAALLANNNQVSVGGMAPEAQLQDRTVGRHQAALLAYNLPDDQKNGARSLVAQSIASAQPGYQVVQPGQPLPIALDSDTQRALDAQWKEVGHAESESA